jgi:hypothetical protein
VLLAFFAMGTRRALLLIADIGGYTEYMQFHRSVLGHAEAATTRMLDKIVDAARGFDLIEIEGDAAFLARDVDGLGGAETLTTLTTACVALHRAFHAERRLVQLNLCPCGSCKTTSALTLKFVAHIGDVATQTIKRRKKLVGLDVIHVHRLLKNPVEIPEYLLVTDELFASGGARESVGGGDVPASRQISLDLEGIGVVAAHVVDIRDIAAPLTDPSWSRRIGGTLAMVGRGLPHMVRRRRPQALSSAR